MRLHRFYINPVYQKLDNKMVIRDQNLLRQWLKVFRYKSGSEVILFDGIGLEAIYNLDHIEYKQVSLTIVKNIERTFSLNKLYLFFSLLKKDKNEWLIQKCTELGVTNFIPVIAKRSEKTGFNIDRAKKIAIEASEQCGRSDIPMVCEPITLQNAIDKYNDLTELFFCEGNYPDDKQMPERVDGDYSRGVFIGPEGGWTDSEKQIFINNNLRNIQLSQFTLRAETACIVAVTKLIAH